MSRGFRDMGTTNPDILSRIDHSISFIEFGVCVRFGYAKCGREAAASAP
jgi:hypothetical protein